MSYASSVTSVKESLGAHLRGMAAPFLFVGAGLSRRYAGTDGWESLLQRFATETPKPYGYYRSSAGQHLPSVASAIAEDFHELWWNEPRYSDSRAEWGDEVTQPDSALKVEASRYLKKVSTNLPTEGLYAEELELLRTAVVDGIITTNYDTVLESAFPSFKTFIGQDELLFSVSQGVGEIYKIHGCCTQPDSLILTANDYNRFEERNPYLAAKLLTIFVEHPVIFLGYSLTDENVIKILNSIVKCLTRENISELENRLIFVQWEKDSVPSIGSHTMQVSSDIVLPVQRIVVPDFTEVFGALSALQRAFPAKLLRRLKQQVYELVATNDPNNRLFVADIDDDTDAADVDVVFGVGVKSRLGEIGYEGGVERWDLIRDVLEEESGLDSSLVLEKSLPRILRSSGNVPVFRYLFEAGALDDSGEIREDAGIDPLIIARAKLNRGGLPTGGTYTKSAPEVLAGTTGVKHLFDQHGKRRTLNYVTYLDADLVDTDELLELITHLEPEPGDQWEKTQFAKVVCFWDWLEFGRG